ncbi:MAG: peptidyl-prolyl cis-trans isomerase [Phycisphaeraceae bacterium]|nr:MAG: peptidyl-prolyl cis-trans isomerase [Phycisphaeraceae bacterium]
MFTTARTGAGIVSLIALIAATLTLSSASAVAREITVAPGALQESENSHVYISMQTSKGEIILELDREKAPISVENFLKYTESEHYDGTIFHRVISNFMIQGGGFTEDMTQKRVGRPIKNEWRNGLSNVRGSIAMARLGNQPDSATSQFFINVTNNAALDQPRDGAGYAVFGKVVKGMDVVDKIRQVPTATRGHHGDVPVEPVVIEKVRQIEKPDDLE